MYLVDWMRVWLYYKAIFTQSHHFPKTPQTYTKKSGRLPTEHLPDHFQSLTPIGANCISNNYSGYSIFLKVIIRLFLTLPITNLFSFKLIGEKQ